MTHDNLSDSTLAVSTDEAERLLQQSQSVLQDLSNEAIATLVTQTLPLLPPEERKRAQWVLDSVVGAEPQNPDIRLGTKETKIAEFVRTLHQDVVASKLAKERTQAEKIIAYESERKQTLETNGDTWLWCIPIHRRMASYLYPVEKFWRNWRGWVRGISKVTTATFKDSFFWLLFLRGINTSLTAEEELALALTFGAMRGVIASVARVPNMLDQALPVKPKASWKKEAEDHHPTIYRMSQIVYLFALFAAYFVGMQATVGTFTNIARLAGVQLDNVNEFLPIWLEIVGAFIAIFAAWNGSIQAFIANRSHFAQERAYHYMRDLSVGEWSTRRKLFGDFLLGLVPLYGIMAGDYLGMSKFAQLLWVWITRPFSGRVEIAPKGWTWTWVGTSLAPMIVVTNFTSSISFGDGLFRSGDDRWYFRQLPWPSSSDTCLQFVGRGFASVVLQLSFLMLYVTFIVSSQAGLQSIQGDSTPALVLAWLIAITTATGTAAFFRGDMYKAADFFRSKPAKAVKTTLELAAERRRKLINDKVGADSTQRLMRELIHDPEAQDLNPQWDEEDQVFFYDAPVNFYIGGDDYVEDIIVTPTAASLLAGGGPHYQTFNV
ncbi:MAG: hypothetical protein DHS20C10_11170 [marine bacterium B5-7]|nr:MAG: hypothetical protein DHS20C10_11170 [marine bacterium B5-7]